MEKKEKIEFKDIKPVLIIEIEKRLIVENLIPDDFILIESFFNQPVQTELSGQYVIGGPTIPMVALIKKTSGQISFFALKALLPDLTI
jgi:hypothetical protein